METMSLPTNATSGPDAGSTRSSAAPIARTSRSNDEPVCASSAAACSRARRPSRRSAAAAGPAGVKISTSTPGGPSRVRSGSAGSSIAAHRLSAVCREPTSTPEAPARPSRANGRKRGGSCLTTYSSALPWIFTAYGIPSGPSARARITGPITRWLASATSGRTCSATARTAATLRSTYASISASVHSRNVLTSKPS